LAPAHQHDALHDVVSVVLAGDAEPRLVADPDLGDVADAHRVAVRGSQHRGLDVVDRADQADPAHHRGLRADIDGIAADIDIAVVEGLQNLRQGQPVGVELVEIDLDVEGLALAAPAGDVDNPRHGTKPAREEPSPAAS